MPARPTWKGYLKISLVNIPIRVFPATDAAATISFNQLHGECQTRIQQKRWCPKCEREVPLSEIVKGYEFEKGRYVVMDEEDMAKVRTESTRVIDLVQFTEAAAIDPIYVERPYYLAPDGAMALDAFAVMREAMKGKAGIGKLALYGREYLVAVQPRDKGLVMYTMRHAKEVRGMNAIEELDSQVRRSWWRLSGVERAAQVERVERFADTLRTLDARRCAGALLAYRLVATPGLAGEAQRRLEPVQRAQ
jgi:DNA end-binding protein Ku